MFGMFRLDGASVIVMVTVGGGGGGGLGDTERGAILMGDGDAVMMRSSWSSSSSDASA